MVPDFANQGKPTTNPTFVSQSKRITTAFDGFISIFFSAQSWDDLYDSWDWISSKKKFGGKTGAS